MKKPLIAIGIVALLAAFAAADFYLNGLGEGLSLDATGSVSQPPVEPAPGTQPVALSSNFRVGEMMEGFRVVSQAVTRQMFDKVNLEGVRNIVVVRFSLEKAPEVGGAGAVEPLTIFEIQGPKDQGALTYLAVKLQFVAQINSTTETINEDGKFGDNSLFYNDKNLESAAFLLAQVSDNVYGFRYDKTNTATYESVKKMIEDLTLKR